MVLEEIEEGSYTKAADVIKRESDKWMSSARDYHTRFFTNIFEKLHQKSNDIKILEKKLKKEKASQKVQDENLVQDLQDELEKQKKKIRNWKNFFRNSKVK